jgi:hypothetical protein
MSLSGDALKLAAAEFGVQLWRSWREGTIFPAAYNDKAKWVYHVQGELRKKKARMMGLAVYDASCDLLLMPRCSCTKCVSDRVPA